MADHMRLDGKLAEAEQRIAAARAEAMAEVETVAAEAARDIVARLAGVAIAVAIGAVVYGGVLMLIFPELARKIAGLLARNRSATESVT